ncbi:MAG: hypothetical protein N2234_06820 [Planctomycetota bacterium]|nr:hypothetical protein [Planctomycetota bacterium]
MEERKIRKYLMEIGRIVSILLNSSEELREVLKMMEKEGYRVNIGFVSMVTGGGMKKKAELRFEVTDEDKEFLKRIGIRYDEDENTRDSGSS